MKVRGQLQEVDHLVVAVVLEMWPMLLEELMHLKQWAWLGMKLVAGQYFA